MRTAAILTTTLALVAVGVMLSTPEPVFIGAGIAALGLIAHLTASPLRVGHARHDTWFDRPEGHVVVHGATRAAARMAR